MKIQGDGFKREDDEINVSDMYRLYDLNTEIWLNE